jgi:hypothetical protein
MISSTFLAMKVPDTCGLCDVCYLMRQIISPVVQLVAVKKKHSLLIVQKRVTDNKLWVPSGLLLQFFLFLFGHGSLPHVK